MVFDKQDLDKSALLGLYEGMLKPRMIEEKMLILLRQGKISKWFSGIGQEAISVGVTKALNKEEYILPMHRNLGVFTSRNIPLYRLFSQWQGKASGFTSGRDRSFHFGQYVENNPELEKEYPDNVEVSEVPKFNEVGKETYKMLEKTAKYVLRALALHLSLEETYFDRYIYNGNSILRPIHYPPITQEPKNAVRAAAHGDINLITLLMGAQGRGLQVQNHDGEWIDAIAEPDELMINVGDMLSRHSNNRLKSTIHRVVNPPRELWGTSRYSIPFFMHPVSDMKLDVLESCIDENNPKQFDDITAGAFLNERLIELGLIKK